MTQINATLNIVPLNPAAMTASMINVGSGQSSISGMNVSKILSVVLGSGKTNVCTHLRTKVPKQNYLIKL